MQWNHGAQEFFGDWRAGSVRIWEQGLGHLALKKCQEYLNAFAFYGAQISGCRALCSLHLCH